MTTTPLASVLNPPSPELKGESVQVTVLNADIYREKLVSFINALVEEELALLKKNNIPSIYDYANMDSNAVYNDYQNNIYAYVLGDEVVGMVCYHSDTKSLTNLYVTDTHRGHGYGVELAEYLLANTDADQLTVVPGNPSRRIYERLGFKESMTWMIKS